MQTDLYLNKNKRFSGGFTFIELSLVIAGFVSLITIVIVSLGSAQDKSADLKIQNSLMRAQYQASLYYDAHKNYGEIKGDTCKSSDLFLHPPILEALNEAATYSGHSVLCVSGDSSGQGVISDSWAVSVQLKSDSSKYWCVDSSGASHIGSESRSGDVAYCSS